VPLCRSDRGPTVTSVADTNPAGGPSGDTRFVKVWRSVGAVAVYSRGRAVVILLTLLLAIAAIAAAAFLGGRASKDDAASVAAPVATSAPPAATNAPESSAGDGTPDVTPAPAKHSYRRGYRAGARAAAPGGAAFFKPGEAYLVKIEKGRHGTPYAIGPHVRIASGFRYRICGGGTKICVVPVAPGTAP
jgi:hypothetical protein